MENKAVRNGPCEWIQNAATRLIKSESTIVTAQLIGFGIISACSFTLAVGSLIIYGVYRTATQVYTQNCRELAEGRIESAVEADQATDLEEATQTLESDRSKALEMLKKQGLGKNIPIVNAVFDRIRNHPDFRAEGKSGKWVADRIREYAPI